MLFVSCERSKADKLIRYVSWLNKVVINLSRLSVLQSVVHRWTAQQSLLEAKLHLFDLLQISCRLFVQFVQAC